MNDLYWLRENHLAGSAGPDRIPWNIQSLKKYGIGKVLSVNDGTMIRASELLDQSIEYLCVPLSDSAPPQPGDAEFCLSVLPNALEFVLAPNQHRGGTLVHCSSGKDRTGMFLCYYLLKVEQCSSTAAIEQVKLVRPIALTAPGWEELTYEVLTKASA